MSEECAITNIEISRINKRRSTRGADAVEIKVSFSNGEAELLWNSKKDLIAIAKRYPQFADNLKDGLDFYG
ncbi:hypothetical protein MAELSTROM_23 [Pseudoalteromonas phage Maelstrom]|uniref:hypothetical protein n=1 Tax=Pseudoalteromonas phage Maelstrom TaxID=2065202 RepID=UPI000CA0C09D|nr:hypothetical protein PP584_gp23 [Pseudoalteromonas phage Maelstrom]AUG84943.1 hypothetical protein MAELSTROM_23 [Pseudoalteromonas phage Maelstrom]